MKKEDFHKGQTVCLIKIDFLKYSYERIENSIKEVKVLSVGKKYITVDFFGKMQFDMTNDFREVTKYSAEYKLFPSKEEIRKYLKRKQMEEEIREAFRSWSGTIKMLTYEELQTILEIIHGHYAKKRGEY